MWDGDEVLASSRKKCTHSSWGPNAPQRPTGPTSGTSQTTPVRSPGAASSTREFVHCSAPAIAACAAIGCLRLKFGEGQMADRSQWLGSTVSDAWEAFA
jgi:hypothetical protein